MCTRSKCCLAGSKLKLWATAVSLPEPGLLRQEPVRSALGHGQALADTFRPSQRTRQRLLLAGFNDSRQLFILASYTTSTSALNTSHALKDHIRAGWPNNVLKAIRMFNATACRKAAVADGDRPARVRFPRLPINRNWVTWTKRKGDQAELLRTFADLRKTGSRTTDILEGMATEPCAS